MTDEVLQNNKEDLGVEVSRPHVSHLLYADDLVIVNKSVDLTLAKDAKHKCRILLEKGFALGAETLPPLKVGDEVTYLGLTF